MRRTNEAFFWLLFSSGGMLVALLFPALFVILWLAVPLGWIEAPSVSSLAEAVGHPLTRFVLWVVIVLAMFHWGHRFRYTLYDGLQLNHLFGLIATICYGGAVVVSIAAAWVLFTF